MELAIQFDSGKPVRVGAIAERRGISSQFLVQILLQLKGAGIVASTRGAAGGYRLARAPCEVTLWQVMSLFQGEAKTEASQAENETPLSHTLKLVWDDVRKPNGRCSTRSRWRISLSGLPPRPARCTTSNPNYS